MKSHIFAAIIYPFFFFSILFLYVKLAGPIPFQINSINTNKTDSFQVTGEGKAIITPDKATITVGVISQAPTAKLAQDQMNQNINKVTKALKSLGIDQKDIQTQNYNVNPEYDYASGAQTIKGYSANTNLIIKVRKIDDANKVLDEATANGATQVGGIQFDNTDKSKAEDEARKMAIADAKNKAELASKTAGFNLGKLINYEENFGGEIRPMGFAADSKAVGESNPTQIEPGQNEINISVTLSYEVR